MGSSRIEPTSVTRKRSINDGKRKFQVPETIAESFEWVASGGKESKTSGDIALHLSIQGIFALMLIFLPYHLAKFLKGDVELICQVSDMNTTFDHYDIVRLCVIFGMGWLIYVGTMAMLQFTIRLIKMSRNRNSEITPAAQKTMESIRFMGPYISLCCGLVAMSIMVKNYYPESRNFNDLMKESHEKLSTTSSSSHGDDEDKVAEDKVTEAFKLFMKIIGIILTFGKIEGTQFYLRNLIPILVNSAAIFIIVLAMEKFILQMIATQYRSATTAGRFNENAFALSVLKELFRTKLTSNTSGDVGKKYDHEEAITLFEALSSHDDESNGDIIKLYHFEKCMDHDQAIKLFRILDVAQNGDLTKDEFTSAVKAVYDEQETLAKLVVDHDDIISKLDEIMLLGVYSIDSAIFLAFLGIPGLEMFAALLGLMFAFGFFFKDAFTKAFDSLLLVLITHPYDLGDRVEIDGKYLYVENVGIWTTTFNGPGGLKTIMTNASLSDEKICNFRRSPAENEVFTYLVRPETVNEESIKSLKEDCIQFFKQNNRDFMPNWHLETYDQIDLERFKIIIKIFHRHNFQNEEAKNERSQKFALFFKDALIRNGFQFSPAYPKAIVAQL